MRPDSRNVGGCGSAMVPAFGSGPSAGIMSDGVAPATGIDVPRYGRSILHQQEPSTGQVSTIGRDLAKNLFQVHGIDADGKVIVQRSLRRAEVFAFFAKLAPCVVGMEACGTAHPWARELMEIGHTVKLMPPAYVKAYVKRGKTDAADAEAIAEAVTRPTMRLVAVKTVYQQGVLMEHKVRELLVRQRTMLIMRSVATSQSSASSPPWGRSG